MVKFDRFQKGYWEKNKPVNQRSPYHPVVQTYVLSSINALIPHININSDSFLLVLPIEIGKNELNIQSPFYFMEELYL